MSIPSSFIISIQVFYLCGLKYKSVRRASGKSISARTICTMKEVNTCIFERITYGLKIHLWQMDTARTTHKLGTPAKAPWNGGYCEHGVLSAVFARPAKVGLDAPNTGEPRVNPVSPIIWYCTNFDFRYHAAELAPPHSCEIKKY